MLIGQSKGQGQKHAKEDEEDLDDIGVADGDQPSQEGVAHCNHCWHDDWHHLVQVEDNLEKRQGVTENL